MNRDPGSGKQDTGKAAKRPRRGKAGGADSQEGMQKPVVSDQRRAASSPLSAILPPLAGRILKAQGGDRRRLTEGALALDWPQIVGDEIARLCRPGKVSPSRGAGSPTSLELLTSPAAALELTHRTPQIIERVNRYFGYAYIDRLNFRHVTMQRAGGRSDAGAQDNPLDAASQAGLEAQLAGLPDSPLKTRLRALGERVIRAQRKKA